MFSHTTKQIIPVILACDENYAKYMSVTIASVVAGTKEQINFYILDGGISDNNKEKLELQLRDTGHILKFVQIDTELFGTFPDIAHFSINTYFRYLIPDLEIKQRKVLYLDVDMVVCGDIAEIYNQNLDNRGIGAVVYADETFKPKAYGKYKRRLNIPPEHHYFNAGLLLIDCEYWKKYDIKQKLFEKTAALKDVLEMPDQDVLNIVFNKNYKSLAAQYNLVVDLTAERHDFNNCISKLKGCFVLHFTGGKGMRPWLHADVPGAKYFWKAAQNSPFYDDLKFDLLSNQVSYIESLFPVKKVCTIKVFGLLPIFKMKQNKNKKKFYLFGIPLFSMERK